MITIKKKAPSANYREIKLVPPAVQNRILAKCNNRYRLLVALMLDCGCRVTEVIRIQIKHIHFMDNYIEILSLKKGADGNGNKITKWRKVPLTERVNDFMAVYWEELKDRSMEAYLFPSGDGMYAACPHLSRKSVWRYIKKKSDGHIYPHKFRHTAATNIVKHTKDLRVARDLLGHESVKTTEIYTHVEDSELFQAVREMDQKPWHVRIYRHFFPKKRVLLTPTDGGLTKYHVGRKKEMDLLSDLMHKKVNVYLNGPKGIGKTHLLDMIGGEKILRLDELTNKTAMGSLLIELFEGDKKAIAAMIYGPTIEETTAEEDVQKLETKKMIVDALSISKKDLSRVVMKNSIKQMCELAIKITKKNEYTIIIDDGTNITNTGVRILEKLNNHFHLIVAARNIKIDKGHFLSNFQKIELQPLQRFEVLELINLASKDLYDRIEDYDTYKNHIWESTNGNPLYTIEMVDRYRKEPSINLTVTKEIQHTAANQGINMTLPFIILVSSLMVLRYYGREAGDDSGAFMLFGGLFMVFALFARPLARLGKRMWV